MADRTPLFRLGEVTLASGRTSTWKIDCDALTPDDWDALALMAVEATRLAEAARLLLADIHGRSVDRTLAAAEPHGSPPPPPDPIASARRSLGDARMRGDRGEDQMTPEEMGEALGPEWVWYWDAWRHESPAIVIHHPPKADEEWEITCADHNGHEALWLAADSAACVSVVHLLVAAERVAGGAEVAERSVYMAHASHDGADRRRLALDLLRAADDAEAHRG